MLFTVPIWTHTIHYLTLVFCLLIIIQWGHQGNLCRFPQKLYIQLSIVIKQEFLSFTIKLLRLGKTMTMWEWWSKRWDCWYKRHWSWFSAPKHQSIQRLHLAKVYIPTHYRCINTWDQCLSAGFLFHLYFWQTHCTQWLDKNLCHMTTTLEILWVCHAHVCIVMDNEKCVNAKFYHYVISRAYRLVLISARDSWIVLWSYILRVNYTTWQGWYVVWLQRPNRVRDYYIYHDHWPWMKNKWPH